MLHKLQMKSVALAKINQITGHNVRPKVAKEQPRQQPGSEEKQFSLVGSTGNPGLQHQNVSHMQQEPGKDFQKEQLTAIKDNRNAQEASLTEEKINLVSINSNPQSQRATPLGYNQTSCVK